MREALKITEKKGYGKIMNILTQARRSGGLGLISLDERVRLVGGRLRITTPPQRGTELRVQVPLGGPVDAPRDRAARR